MLARRANVESRASALSSSVLKSKSNSNVELKQRYLTIRTYFSSLNERTSSPPIQIAKTQRKLLQNRPYLSPYRAFLSTQDRNRNPEPSSQTDTNDAHDTHQTSKEKHVHSQTHEYPSYIRRLTSSLPPLHRPTKDEMLTLATGFWERMKIRFKWFTIRGFRKFDTDDMSAFLSWFVLSQAVWIMVGTTTFFSVVFATFNSFRMQEFVARQISNYLTKETGWTIVFESAIVPKWKDGQISFKRTYISRHPDLVSSGASTSSASSSEGHPAHTVATRFDAHLPTLHNHGEDDIEPLVRPPPVQYERLEDLSPEQRITTFDLEVDSVDVELSLRRWLDGKGLVQHAVVKGVRGIVDRRLVPITSDIEFDLSSFRHPNSGFEVESLQLEDVLVTIYQPQFRPYTASIFQADFRLLRKKWLFYDLLSAKSIVGQFDNCLFSLHEPQSIGRTMSEDLKDTKWKRMSRLRIDGVNIDHLQTATGTTAGPISWITAGKVDAVLDIKFPRDDPDVDISALFNEIAHNISVAASGQSTPSSELLGGLKHATLSDRIPGQRELAKPALRSPIGGEEGTPVDELQAEMNVVIDIDLRFRDLKAAVPLFTRDLSYVNQALVRPIVAFINANRTLVPIHCTVVKELADFDGSWTAWETGLTDTIALQIYEALAYHVTRSNMNRRIKAVSTWSLQMTANAVISALRNIVDPVSAHLREISSDEHLYLG